jgi:hypothetical protein
MDSEKMKRDFYLNSTSKSTYMTYMFKIYFLKILLKTKFITKLISDDNFK